MPDLSPTRRADLPSRRAWGRARRLTQETAVFTVGQTIRCPGVYHQPSGVRVVCGEPRGEVRAAVRVILRRGQSGERCPNCGSHLEERRVVDLPLEATG